MLTHLPLPSIRHVPGSGSAPEPAFFAPIKAQCPAKVSNANWRDVLPYLYGFDLYASEYFWEAHEVWEPVWMACAPNSRDRQLLAGLIQLANACLKLEMDRIPAVRRLLKEAMQHVAEAAQEPHDGFLMGLAVGRLARSLAAYAALLRAQAPIAAGALVKSRPRLVIKL
jgi:hypothetical protein